MKSGKRFGNPVSSVFHMLRNAVIHNVRATVSTWRKPRGEYLFACGRYSCLFPYTWLYMICSSFLCELITHELNSKSQLVYNWRSIFRSSGTGNASKLTAMTSLLRSSSLSTSALDQAPESSYHLRLSRCVCRGNSKLRWSFLVIRFKSKCVSWCYEKHMLVQSSNIVRVAKRLQNDKRCLFLLKERK